MDDLQARIVATGMGLRITGTLGVLLAAKQQNLILDLAQAIKDLQTEGFHIARELTEAFLKINGEQRMIEACLPTVVPSAKRLGTKVGNRGKLAADQAKTKYLNRQLAQFIEATSWR